MSTPFYDLASLVVVPSGYKASKVYAQKPLTTDGQLAFTRSTTATRVNSAGLIESVAINVPRLDYLNSSCPRLLLEPQRVNLVLWSESFDNAGWTKENLTITANSVTSPSGYQDADTLTDNSTSGRHRVAQNLSATNGTTYTYSVFVKKNSSGRFLLINAATLFNARAALDLDTLAVTNLNGTGKVEDYGNGWYRFSVTGTATATSTTATYIQMQNSASDVNYVGNGSSFYLWGAQFEAGAYATSYIPTLGAAVTRGADAATKTGISSLIGQTEGTLFVEFFYNEENNTPSGSDKSVMRVESGGGYSNEICITYYGNEGGAFGKTIQGIIANGGAQQAVLKTTQTMVSGYYKVAVAYKANDFAMAVNGVIVATDNSGSVPTCANFSLNESTRIQSDINPKQALLFTTRLTNAQLAELTTI